LTKDYLKIFLVLIFVALILSCGKETEQTADQLVEKSIQDVREGQIVDAEQKAEKALKIIEAEYGPQSPEMIKPLQVLSITYRKKGDLNKAEQSYQRIIAILQNSEGDNDVFISQVMNNLAGLHYYQNKYKEAISVYKESLEIAENQFSRDDPRVTKIRKNIETCQSAISGSQDGNVLGTGKQGMAAISQKQADAMPLETREGPQDLLPDKIKQTALKKLAKQDINLSNLQPLEPVIIGRQGAVLPYRCIQESGENGEESIEAVLLFAMVRNQNKAGAFIFKRCRMVSYESYQEELQKNGMASLAMALKEVFPGVYS